MSWFEPVCRHLSFNVQQHCTQPEPAVLPTIVKVPGTHFRLETPSNVSIFCAFLVKAEGNKTVY